MYGFKPNGSSGKTDYLEIGYSGKTLYKYKIKNGTLTKDLSNPLTFDVSSIKVIDRGVLYSGYIPLKGELNFANLTTIKDGGLSSAFEAPYDNKTYEWVSKLTTVSFPKLTSVGVEGLYNAFRSTSLTSIRFDALSSITTESALDSICYSSSVKTAYFPQLTSISGWLGFSDAFAGCSDLTTISFPKLQSVTGEGAMYNAFYGCTSLTTVEFPNLTTIGNNSRLGGAMKNCFERCTGIKTLKFKSSLKNNSNLTKEKLFGGTTSEYCNPQLQILFTL